MGARCGGKVRSPTQIGCLSEGIPEVIWPARLSLNNRSGGAAEKFRVVGREALLVAGSLFASPEGIDERIGRFGGRRRFFGICHGDSGRNRRRR
jgi:hypothetical protein